MHPVRLFCWHFMAYPYLPSDFDARYDSGWVTVPNTLWDGIRMTGCPAAPKLGRWQKADALLAGNAASPHAAAGAVGFEELREETTRRTSAGIGP
jgi:hypothetical protein